MWIANDWKEYEVIDTSCGEKLERWGKYTLVRPDPQVIWDTPKISRGWKNMNAHYHRSKKGGGEWEFFDVMKCKSTAHKKLLSRLSKTIITSLERKNKSLYANYKMKMKHISHHPQCIL